MPDDCKACNDLRAEAGEHFDFYAKKLLIRGWAGVMTPVERAYMRRHRSEAQQEQAKAAAARAKSRGFGGFSRSTDEGTDGTRTDTPDGGL